ncbi:DUF1697 domain-containing protein [Microbacterium sp. 3J1]|uniref:DUF1697 domain-containing protein n=1 Tax=Microbacterium sp. 3J1 TaxID=861269 RepID=UPI000B2CDFDA|nr:DUF1697 domain-containing protein [Microbacterium sp. 3J1]
MTRSVLLLRAVNVGGRSRVPMARLREVLEPELGKVSTYIASGNIVCAHPSDPRAASERVRSLIAAEFDVDTPVIVRTHEDLRAALDALPFPDASEKMLHAMFLGGPAAAGAVDALLPRLVSGERIALIGDELWIDYGEGGVRSTKLTTAVLDRALGVAGTARNLRTLRTLTELTA